MATDAAETLAADLYEAYSRRTELGPSDVCSLVRRYHDMPPDGLFNLADKLMTLCKGQEVAALVEGSHLTDRVLDGIVGIEAVPLERVLAQDSTRIKQQYPTEQTWVGLHGVWSSYRVIKNTVQALELTGQDTAYDLGAGYGRWVTYASIVTPARCKGIELLQERVSPVQQTIGRLGLDNAEMSVGNVLEEDFSDGTVFYMFCPFSSATRLKVVEQLCEVARQHPIRLACYQMGIRSGQDWLRPAITPQLVQGVEFVESVPPDQIAPRQRGGGTSF